MASSASVEAKSRKLAFLLTLPGLLWLTALLIVPCGLILAYSFFERGTYGGVVYSINAQNFLRTFESTYITIFLTSVKIAALATLIALIVAYPAAYAIFRLRARWQLTVLFLVILPFWSNYLIRSYAWMVILNNQGVANHILMSTGLISQPLKLLYNEFAVVLGLVYSYLPFVILSIFASIQRLNPELLEASADLGSPPWRTFVRVMLPMTAPGIAAGAVFVFVLSIGNFVTPDILGGGQITMVGNVVYGQFMSARDWPFGSALALFLLTIMFGLLSAQAYFTRNSNSQAGRSP